jgi:hypothetical protein
MVGRSGAINIKEVAEIGGSVAATGAGASAFAPRRRVFLAGAAASTTASTVAGAFEFARRVAGFATSAAAAAALATPFFATVFAGALAWVLAGALASALTAGFAAALDAALLTGFFESVTGAFVSFLITISGALQAACFWATLTSCKA